MARTQMELEKATVTVMTGLWWHLILLPQMRHRKGSAEGDMIHADKKSISPLTPDLRQSWKYHGKKWNIDKHQLLIPYKQF